MLKINLKQLEAFVATAEYCSFTKAAEAVYLTQSTVSSHISTLEDVLGVRLIQRGARQRVALTEEGKKVYREAKDILDRCQTLQDQGSHNSAEQLVIASSTIPSQYIMPDLMTDFLKQYPECRYVQLRGDSTKVHQYLEEGKAHIGFVGIAANRKTHHYHPVAKDKLVVITSNREPYSSYQTLGTTGLELLDEPMILREESSGTRKAMEAYFSCNGISTQSLRIVAQIDNTEAIKSSVSRGMGVSVISDLAVREEVESGRLLSFDLGASGTFRKLYLVWRKDAELTPLEDTFIKFVCERNMIHT